MNSFRQCLSKDLYYISILSEDESEIITSKWVTAEELQSLQNKGVRILF